MITCIYLSNQYRCVDMRFSRIIIYIFDPGIILYRCKLDNTSRFTANYAIIQRRKFERRLRNLLDAY